MSEQPILGADRSAPIRLGFTRGVSPSKWADRWKRAVPERELEIVPIPRQYGRSSSEDALSCDMLIERAAPGDRPTTAGIDGIRTHHAMFLYEEAVALVVAKDHELAEHDEIYIGDLALVKLLDYPNHAPEWPAAEPWEDPAWAPKNLAAALELVATGIGGVLVSLPLAKHVSTKREHALLRIVGDVDNELPLPGTTVWATWPVANDSSDLQQLAGVMRGRTARSSRRTHDAPAAKPVKQTKPQQQAKKKPKLKPNSRGAQLAAVREKAARNKAIKAAEKRKKR